MENFITKDHRNYTIRKAEEKDAEGVLAFVRLIFSTSDQVLTTPDEFSGVTIEDEKNWIKKYNEGAASIILLAEVNEQIIGVLDFAVKEKVKMRHSGEFGVSVHPDFQNSGIGKKLIETLLYWTRNNVWIEKVFLNVFATNTQAIHLYKKLGFVEEARQVKAIKQPNGSYTDLIQLYQFVK